MTKALLIAAGTFLTLLGIVMMFTPIPGSSFSLAVGIAVLICSSETAASCLRFFRSRAGWLNKVIAWLEERAGTTIGDALRRSRPIEPTMSKHAP